MTNEFGARPMSTLDELERQLRVASRGTNPAPQEKTIDGEAPVTDNFTELERIATQFARSTPVETQDEAPAADTQDPHPESETLAPPPAFLMANAKGPRQQGQGFPADFDEVDQFNGSFPPIERQRSLGGNIVRGLIGLFAAVAIGGFSYLLFAGKLTGTSSEPKTVPVIKADPAPVKVVPEPTQAAEAEQPKDILAKPGANAPAPVVVVKPATEAPVDVNAAIKAELDKTEKAGTAIEMPPAPKPGPSALVPGIGEPKPVRTVTVRPDGTIVGDTPFSPLPPPAQNVAQAPAPQATVAPSAAAPQDTAPQPAKSPPAGKNSAATTPTTAAGTNAPGTTTAGAPVVLPPQRPADKNGTKVQPQPQIQAQPQTQPDPGLDALAAMAAGAEDATPAAAAPAKPAAAATAKASLSSGDFSIQFGAPTVEADAKGLAKRISTKFAGELGGIDVAVIKADAAGKTVYRVRAQGLSRDDAAALCAKIAAQGAQCFVAKN